MYPAILIHGPTASGKSAVAAAFAKQIGGEVVNADSMQVYRELSVLTARPTAEEMQGVPHHLFGHVDAAERYSTGKWLEDVGDVLRDIESRGKTPVLVGGTGLYFLALTAGLSEIPPVPEDIRADVRAIAADEGGAGLKARLKDVDPESATRLAEGDRQRLSRAYEVWLATGKPFSSFTGKRKSPLLMEGDWMGVALTPPRNVLYGRIEARFDAMMTNGAMQEVQALAARRLDPELPAMKAHGMPWLAAYIHGDITADVAVDRAKRDTRRYAKRQFTWIGRQFPFWPRIPATDLEMRKKVIFALYNDVDGH
ncbi:MAG: tRNA (adenosine(37)-N6)-dimethylallyltransferase MiaA [Pseudomonadota bacterium]